MEPIFTRRLPLAGAPNTRDLGGYASAGGVTRWQQFIRSASTFSMLPQDIEALREYGIKTAIDLRSDTERQSQPSALEMADGFICHHVPMLDQMNSSHFSQLLPSSMGELYISMLDDSSAGFAKVFSIFAASTGGILFHCTGGKDRTGMVSMLLLQLAGVADADIIADYAVSELYMWNLFKQQQEALRGNAGGQNIPDYLFRSQPKDMVMALQHLAGTYGTAEKYLLQAGVSPDTLATVKAKFTKA